MMDDTNKTDEPKVDAEIEKEMEGVPEHLRDDGADEPEHASDGEEGESLSDAIEALRGELAEAKQEVLYARADTQNVRRRMEKDVTDARTYAATGFARDILSVADNLARAIDSIPEALRKMTSSRGWWPGSRRRAANWTRSWASTASRASLQRACRSTPMSTRR